MNKLCLLPDFAGKRLLKISLRALHLVGLAGFAGGIMLGILPSELKLWWHLLLASGIGLIILDVLSNLIWLIQLRGILIAAKLMVLGGVWWWPDHAPMIVIGLILLSAVVAHAPSGLRYWSVVHRKKMKTIGDIKG